MQLKLFALATFMATGVLAAPGGGSPPPPPPPVTVTKTVTKTSVAVPTATVISQQNSCGNGGTEYCCTGNNSGGYSVCKAMVGSSICSATTVCCNANNSVQVCLGSATIL